MAACAAGGASHEALKLLERMKGAALQKAQDGAGGVFAPPVPDTVSFNQGINACAAAGW